MNPLGLSSAAEHSLLFVSQNKLSRSIALCSTKSFIQLVCRHAGKTGKENANTWKTTVHAVTLGLAYGMLLHAALIYFCQAPCCLYGVKLCAQICHAPFDSQKDLGESYTACVEVFLMDLHIIYLWRTSIKWLCVRLAQTKPQLVEK